MFPRFHEWFRMLTNWILTKHSKRITEKTHFKAHMMNDDGQSNFYRFFFVHEKKKKKKMNENENILTSSTSEMKNFSLILKHNINSHPLEYKAKDFLILLLCHSHMYELEARKQSFFLCYCKLKLKWLQFLLTHCFYYIVYINFLIKISIVFLLLLVLPWSFGLLKCSRLVYLVSYITIK